MTTSVLDLAASGNAGSVMRDMRVRALFSPYYLTKVVLGYHHLVDHLHLHDSDLFVDRWAAGNRKQWIEWPRGFFKSTTFTIGTAIWVVCPVSDEDTDYALEQLLIPEDRWFARVALHDQDATQLLAFETMPNAQKKVSEIKWHFEENSLFRALFPEIAYVGEERPWNNQCIKIRRTGYGRRSEEGSFEAIGVDGALQSRHYKIVWEDDLVGKAAVESETTMQHTIRWHGLLHGAFENAAQQIRFGISNRWGYADLNSHVRSHEPDFIFYTRAAWELDPETGKEVAIFPERYSMEALINIRDSGSMSRYDFASQYLNQPVLPGEMQVNMAALHSYEVAEDGLMTCSCGFKTRPSQLFRVMFYDPYNAKVTSTSCPALGVVGLAPDKHIFLLDYWTSKGSYSKVFERIFGMGDRWRPDAFTYEDVGHQNVTEFTLKTIQNSTDFKHSYKFRRVLGVPTHGKAKEVRIRERLFPKIENKPYKFSRRATQVLFDSQLQTFPNKVFEHDYDLLDGLSQSTEVWQFPSSEEAALEARNSEAEFEAELAKPYSVMVDVL